MQQRRSGKAARKPNEQRSRETRDALIDAARKLFVDKGFADTGTPEIVRAAELTRGALYHHFADKTDLFRAVVRAEFAAVAEEIDRAAGAPGSALEALKKGGDGFLDAMSDPARVRLVLLDGPAVLGREEIDEIDRSTSGDSLRLGLEAAIDAGELRPLPLDALTDVFSALFDRAALAIAAGGSRAKYREAIAALVDGLAIVPEEAGDPPRR